MIRVGMSFYPDRGEEIVMWEWMPQVPATGTTVHYSLSSDPGESRAWRVDHVSWVYDDNVWHAEIGLS